MAFFSVLPPAMEAVYEKFLELGKKSEVLLSVAVYPKGQSTQTIYPPAPRIS